MCDGAETDEFHRISDIFLKKPIGLRVLTILALGEHKTETKPSSALSKRGIAFLSTFAFCWVYQSFLSLPM